jgi:LPXTG-site transpeptidase (sortase) family protein
VNYKEYAHVNLIIAVSLVMMGVVSVSYGFRKVSKVSKLINSPLDQAAVVNIEDKDIPAKKFDLPDENFEFLPIYVSSDQYHLKKAPEVPNDQRQNTLSSTFTESEEPIPELIPERLIIETIGVDAAIVPIDEREVEYLGEIYRQWNAPRSSDLGWHNTSALIGSPGNTVINGHSNGYGDAFKDLADLKNGDIIEAYSGEYRYTYVVANVLILKERWESIETRMENAKWINPSDDERLTLISCWPNTSNTHRLVVVAIPFSFSKVVQDGNQDLKHLIESIH